jgi:hypothetical protein
MMKTLSIACVVYCACVVSVNAQVGRFEEPVDTIPIGGAIQENKLTQMEAQDELTSQLIAIRDSLHLIRPQSIALKRRSELDAILKGMKGRDQTPELMKKGYSILAEIRAELRSLESSSIKP